MVLVLTAVEHNPSAFWPFKAMAELILSEFDKSGELLATFSDEGSEIHAQVLEPEQIRARCLTRE